SALVGWGTVGTGVVEVLGSNREKIAGLTGESLTISHVLVNDINKKRGSRLDGAVITDDIEKIMEDDTVDIVIEVMGGIERTKNIMKAFVEKVVRVIIVNKGILVDIISVDFDKYKF